MTTGIEYTQVFTYTYTGIGGSTGYQYFQMGNTLQTAGSVFVVKYLSVSSTSGIANTSPAYALQVVSASSNVGAGSINVLTNNNAVGTNVPITVLHGFPQESVLNADGNQVILNQNYIGINVNMVSTGIFYATISYSLIPIANTTLAANFGILSGTSTGLLSIFDSGTSTRILKSVFVSNFDTTETYAIQFILKTGGALSSYLTEVFTLAPGDSVCYSLPLYLTSSSSIALYGLESLSPGGIGLSFYCSYISETN